MLSDHDLQVLARIERRLLAEDPDFVRPFRKAEERLARQGVRRRMCTLGIGFATAMSGLMVLAGMPIGALIFSVTVWGLWVARRAHATAATGKGAANGMRSVRRPAPRRGSDHAETAGPRSESAPSAATGLRSWSRSTGRPPGRRRWTGRSPRPPHVVGRCASCRPSTHRRWMRRSTDPRGCARRRPPGGRDDGVATGRSTRAVRLHSCHRALSPDQRCTTVDRPDRGRGGGRGALLGSDSVRLSSGRAAGCRCHRGSRLDAAHRVLRRLPPRTRPGRGPTGGRTATTATCRRARPRTTELTHGRGPADGRARQPGSGAGGRIDRCRAGRGRLPATPHPPRKDAEFGESDAASARRLPSRRGSPGHPHATALNVDVQ